MFVYSTLTNSLTIADYIKRDGGVPTKKRQVLINGGANLASKHLITPQGVVTELSNDDYDFVKENKMFQRMVERGFIKVDAKKMDVEKVVADMESRDESAPLVPQDFEDTDGAKPTGTSATLPSDPHSKRKGR
jgi:hypothetical protein